MKGWTMRYYRSQWESALSDLKDAAHDAGVSPEQTDAWAVRFDVVPGELGEAFGAYDAAGTFRVLSVVGSPTALRELSRLYPAPTAELPPTTRDADGESDDDTERSHWAPMGDARTWPV